MDTTGSDINLMRVDRIGYAVVGSALLGSLVGDPAVHWSGVPRLCATALLYDCLLTPILVPAVTFLARRADTDTVERRARR